MATLEHALRERISSAKGWMEQDRLKAELAAYLARMGRFSDASATLRDVRSREFWLSAEVSISLFFAEAMIGLEDDYAAAALDRLRRALAIAIAAGAKAEAARAAAWIGHFYFNQCDNTAFARAMGDAVHRFGASDGEAGARVDLTLATAKASLGDMTGADKLFARVRSYSTKNGDEAFLAASLHNRPVYGIARARVANLRGQVADSQLAQLELELNSAANYAQATKNSAASSLIQLWRARLCLINGESDKAVQIFRSLRETFAKSEASPIGLQLEADLAFADVDVVDPEAAATRAALLSELNPQRLHPDDRVVFLAQLKAIQQRAGMTLEAAATAQAESVAWSEYDLLIDQTTRAIRQVEATQ